jgi:hypothetical protein
MALWARFFPLCSHCFLFIPPSFCAPWSTPALGACILFVKYHARTHVPTYTVVHASFCTSALSASPCGIADISCVISSCALLALLRSPTLLSLACAPCIDLRTPRLPTPRCTRTLAYTLACTVNLHPYFSALLHRAMLVHPYPSHRPRAPRPHRAPSCPPSPFRSYTRNAAAPLLPRARPAHAPLALTVRPRTHPLVCVLVPPIHLFARLA